MRKNMVKERIAMIEIEISGLGAIKLCLDEGLESTPPPPSLSFEQCDDMESRDSKSQCFWDGRQYMSNLQLNTGKTRTYCELE